MRRKTCVYCKQKFQPSWRNSSQRVCSSPECQRRRRADYRRKKFATDWDYREECRRSRKRWRERNADRIKQYDKEYRARRKMRSSRCVEKSRLLKEVNRLAYLVRNSQAVEIRTFGPNVLLICPSSPACRPSRKGSAWQPQMIWWRVPAWGPRKMPRGRELSGHRWAGFSDMTLCSLVGYKQLHLIARVLHRSEGGVRCRLLTLAKRRRRYGKAGSQENNSSSA